MAKPKKKVEKTDSTSSRKRLSGVVVSNKMKDTLVVSVDRIVAHPVYKKRRTLSKRYKAHYTEGEYSVGDKVEIEETKPMSKDKRWLVIKK